jgi:predicted acetyltransferase
MSNPTIEVRGCKSAEELNKVVELCDAAFPKTPIEYFARHVLKDKTLAFDDTRILLKDGKIVSSVQVFPRIINTHKGELQFGGIGNVATLPSERNNGYAGILLKDALAYMINKGFPVSMLTTHINSYYEKFGFKTIIRNTAHIDQVEGKLGKEIREFNTAIDLEKVMNLYNEFNNKKLGTIVRDKKYWLSQLDFSGEDKDLFLVYESNDELNGFIRAERKENIIRILEYAFKYGDKTILKKLTENLSFLTGIKVFELFLTKKEEENIDTGFSFSLKIEDDFMICFLFEKLDEEIKDELLKDRNLNFWQSDFF